MSLADVTSARSPSPEACPECDTSASVTSDLHKYQVACTCKPASVQYACADDPGPPPPAKIDTPPALPPRPPASALAASNRRNNANLQNSSAPEPTCHRRKYAWWCVGCGALAAALGGLLAAAHILLRAYTASPHHLETVPAAVPAAMLVLTGLCIMSLARRRNRYSYMIKVVGACCLVCALTCVLVTITTTVIHMNKLQTLKFCEYTKLTRTCTCYSMPPDTQHLQEDEGVRCVFEGVTDCSVVHGVLYWCLRGVFALSVTAVLVCIFSCMLAYQLLSHERKKMYWEQLELRCRSLYRPPTGQTSTAGRPVQSNCSCCAQCHPPQSAWDVSLQHRFWAPGRIGNLYSPNPGTLRKNSAWSWFPWPRTSQNSRCRMGIPQSGDSAYGFCETDQPPNQAPNPNQQYEDRPYPQNYPRQQNQQNANFSQSFADSGGSYDHQTGVWGPPPPYSPQGRSGSRHHLHHQDPATATLLHHHHIDIHRNSMPIHDHTNLGSNLAIQNVHTCSRNSSYIPHNIIHQNEITSEMRLNPELVRINPELVRINPELVRMNPELVRINPELVRINPNLYPQEMQDLVHMQELSLGNESRFNTLRGHLVPYPNCQRSLGISMGNLHRDCRISDENIEIECMHQKSVSKVSDQSSDSCQKQGKENLGFQTDKHPMRASMQDCHRNNAESEVYFADVSSCCNVSVKADCCMNPSVSALVGTIENHPESTSESDTGSFTRNQRMQPQPIGTKRRPRTNPNLKNQEKNRELNNSLRENHQFQPVNVNESISQQNSLRFHELNLSSRLNDSTHSRMSDNHSRMNDSTHSRMNDSTHSRMNDSTHSRMNDSSHSRINESSHSRLNDSNHSIHHSRMNDSNHRMNDSRLSDLNSSLRLDALRNYHPRQSSTDSNMSLKNNPEFVKNNLEFHKNTPEFIKNNLEFHKNIPEFPKNTPEFFVPPPPSVPITPLTPNTEESVISDEEAVVVKPEKPESSKCLGPDSQYELRESKEVKVNHHHCYSDTNTMDSGWQSGSEKHATD